MEQKQCVLPFMITDTIVEQVSEISELIGALSAWQDINANPYWQRDNRIKMIHSSLAIEDNSLPLDQVAAIVKGKQIQGAPGEIQAAKNACAVYEQLPHYNPYSLADFLSAHQTFMNGLARETGVFRSGSVKLFNGRQLVYMAPPADAVPGMIGDLLAWTRDAKVHPLIKSCVFLFEFEYILPFADGNGRMGRMWNTLLLHRWKPIFAWLPIEALLQERLHEYYAALGEADMTADSTPYIEFLLAVICDTLKAIPAPPQSGREIRSTVRMLLGKLDDDTLSARQIMDRLGLKNRASFRKFYLVPALEQGLIEMEFPDKPNSSKQRYKRS